MNEEDVDDSTDESGRKVLHKLDNCQENIKTLNLQSRSTIATLHGLSEHRRPD